MIASDRLLAAIDAGLAEATEAAAWAAWAARAARAAAWAAAEARQEHCRVVRQLIPFEEIERRM